MDEHSVFPQICPVTGWRVLGCASMGCKYLQRTPVHHYLYCAHPHRDCFQMRLRLVAADAATAGTLSEPATDAAPLKSNG